MGIDRERQQIITDGKINRKKNKGNYGDELLGSTTSKIFSERTAPLVA
jgi:hypothetical protein